MNNPGEIRNKDHDSAVNGWNDLKNVEFAGGENGRSVRYNEKYINDFGRDKLRSILGNEKALKITAEFYIEQYDPNSRTLASHITGKSALDNFVVERLSSEHPEMFIKSQEFKNYADYIMSIADKKKFESSDGSICLYPEYFTNPVFKDKNMREMIFRTAYPNTDIDKMNTWFDQHKAEYEGTIKNFVENGIEKRRRLSQKQMDIIGDYIYAGENFDDGIVKKYAEYCFNEIGNDSKIKPSVPMLGALTNYFAKCYTIDDKVKETSKIIIASNPYNKLKSGDEDYEKKEKEFVGASSSSFCVLGKKHFLDMSLASDESLNKSRTNKYNDIYRLMMITFHELTHDHQKNMEKSGDTSSSAMSHILNRVLNRNGLQCYTKTGKNGETIRGSYYNANHDNDEIEVQADEEAWRQCRAFLVEHQKLYAWKHKDKKLEDDFSRRWGKCIDNEKEVRARRAFTKKLAETGEEVSPTQYDIANMKTYVKESPDLLKQYPQLGNFVDSDGNLKLDILFDSKIAKVNYEGLDERTDTFGVEFGSYLLTNQKEANRVVEYVNKNGANLRKEQVDNLLSNLWNIVHQNVLKSRALKNINFENYDETHARGKDQTMQELNNSLLRNYMHECYNAIHIAEIVRSLHPELSEKISKEEDSYIGSYYPELSREGKLESDFAKKVAANYTRTQNPTLLKIATMLEHDYIF